MKPMSRWVYPGFTRLNNRRCDLINKKFSKRGLSDKEARELDMLQEVVDKFIYYASPMPDPLARLRNSGHPEAKKMAEKIDKEVNEEMLKTAHDRIFKLRQTLQWVCEKAELTYKQKVAIRVLLEEGA